MERLTDWLLEQGCPKVKSVLQRDSQRWAILDRLQIFSESLRSTTCQSLNWELQTNIDSTSAIVFFRACMPSGGLARQTWAEKGHQSRAKQTPAAASDRGREAENMAKTCRNATLLPKAFACRIRKNTHVSALEYVRQSVWTYLNPKGLLMVLTP